MGYNGHNRAVGRKGEDLACIHLMELGHTILERNWRSGHLEIDIISLDRNGIHFVEVKTRRVGGITTPEEALTAHKFSALLQSTKAYMAIHCLRLEPQFDLAAVDLHPNGTLEVRFVERAMECSW